jgi:hypothetical protein
MRKNIRVSVSVFVALLLTILLGNAAFAQHLISSKAGFVNHAEGKVYILRQDSENGERGRASLGTQMRDGDSLMTEAAGRAEILLNPGSYLRLDENSEVRAINTTLAQARFELIKGSILVEVGEIDKTTPIEIITRHGSLFAVKDVLLRIDERGDATSVSVRQGEIYLGAREEVLAKKAFKIGRGKAAQLTGSTTPTPVKIGKDIAADNFDIYSFNRAEKLMAANTMALRQSRTYGTLSYGWIYDPFFSCYTFIPRRGMFWSPYGFGFFNSFGNCYTCAYWPYGYGYGYGGYGYPSGGRPTGGSSGGGGAAARVVAGLDRAPIRREIEGRRIDSGAGFDGGSRGDFGSSRSISMPSSAPPTISSPAPTRSESGGTTGGSRGSLPSRNNN